ncbi:hypothetical protein [Paenibacillus sp. CMAA1364]
MNRWIIFMCTLLICILTLIFLPKLMANRSSILTTSIGNVSVFNSQHTDRLSDDNLVDRLSVVAFTLPIRTVEWSKSILTMDLKVVQSDTNATEIYQNMAEAISFCFQDTSNVDRLMIRIVAENKWVNKDYLLLAADITRENWNDELTNELKGNGEKLLREQLKLNFHITETKLWQNQFQQP